MQAYTEGSILALNFVSLQSPLIALESTTLSANACAADVHKVCGTFAVGYIVLASTYRSTVQLGFW